MVGCVLVRDGEVVGEGYHARFGGPHAEVVALEAAGDRSRGATAFVSLEPCAHYGQTPPCTLALLEAGVSRVVFGGADPGTESGGGAESLGRAGVEILGPVLTQEEAIRENAAFFWSAGSSMTPTRATPSPEPTPSIPDRPHVTLKLALSVDGRINGPPGARTHLSGPEALNWVQELRAGFDGILVGGETARIDDPLLTVRGPRQPVRPPVRILLDRTAGIGGNARVFQDRGEGAAPVAIFVSRQAREAEMERLEALGAAVHPVRETARGLDLGEVMHVLRETGVHALLCEGGGRLAASLLEEGMVNRLHLLLAPALLGPDGVPAVDGTPSLNGFVPSHTPQVLGRDVLLTYDRVGG
jgi:diaminohydroxyphosphoribosylaminopyrimidine deaminase/5-amino-6-(5-phosphoribosylamino)uracil reductase